MMDEDLTGWFSRFRSLRGLWRDIALAMGAAPRLAADLPADDADYLRDKMRQCLSSQGGEVAARARAAQLGRAYLDLSQEGRLKFLRILAGEFGTDKAAVDKALAAVVAAAGPDSRSRAERKLKAVLEPARVKLLTQFTSLPEGVKFLVDMRDELTQIAKGDPIFEGLADDLKSLLAGWFDVGFLELHRITWRSPALILEKIMAYEAVHAIQGWADLKNRLDSDRRLYAFFHPRMPDEPLIFVEVALTRGMAGNVQKLLDEHAPVEDIDKADTAIFYSINNAQRGLNGISFGTFLIKRVVDALIHEMPNLKTFATLSPIPGFRAWAEKNGLAGKVEGAGETALLPLVARYLTELNPDTGRARDPVAQFHLSNGARMERLNWAADASAKGQAQSCGVMVNYLYRLSDIEANHEAYTGRGKVATSTTIKALLKGA
jgi:malonyl-CoA decarboxylase